MTVTVRPFEDVVRVHGPTVLRVCRAVLGPAAADDAWSETFLSAMRAYPALPAGSNIEAWLVTIAKRKAIDQHRAAARNPTPVEVLPEREVEAASRSWEDEDALWSALKSLPVKQREAIAYHHIAGLPYKEVALILGNNESAARRAAADGMKALRADRDLRTAYQTGAT
ncbi:RNA polymerase sigma factor (sigma-70 family) [Antricoccus suffuscus]|uniref:RNA polymerase sigma factor (Sigma-70 family) n=1 Tax=Antricoccus suffuscus TaxID=1629062 RepID=A0A2T1A0T9_9ACTN|nr:RNA polymerase sigma factor [Antricoccus suffuscus]PRZ42215.1 RNA polymerase sigma factor (sigma-70 family) [Antricoccus suffuscus]